MHQIDLLNLSQNEFINLINTKIQEFHNPGLDCPNSNHYKFWNDGCISFQYPIDKYGQTSLMILKESLIDGQLDIFNFPCELTYYYYKTGNIQQKYVIVSKENAHHLRDLVETYCNKFYYDMTKEQLEDFINNLILTYHDPNAVKPDESPGINHITKIWSDGTITSEKGGWAYGQRSIFTMKEKVINCETNQIIDIFHTFPKQIERKKNNGDVYTEGYAMTTDKQAKEIRSYLEQYCKRFI